MKSLVRKYIRKQINLLFEGEESGSSLGSLGGLDALAPKGEDQVQSIEDLQTMASKTIETNNNAIKQIELQKKNLELNKKRANQEVKSTVPADPLTPEKSLNALKSVNTEKVKNIDDMQKDNIKKSVELSNQNKELLKKVDDMEKMQKDMSAKQAQAKSTLASPPATS